MSFRKCGKNNGGKCIPINEEHPSLLKIKENLTVQSDLQLKPVDEEFVNKQIGRLKVKKATDHAGISLKILKLARTVIVKPITNLISLTLEWSKFP